VKRDGSLYEQIFFAEALKHGLEVFPPLGDYLPVDCLIMNAAGRVFKVQIKGTAKPSIEGRGKPRYIVTTSFGTSKKTTIDCTKVDIVVAYLSDINLFYIIPCMALDGAKRIGLYALNDQSKAKHEKYREAWDLFKIP
jgi:hypothetical protein